MFKRIEDRYHGRTAVVIGAGGIGGAISRLLAGNVAKLVVADRDERTLLELKASLGNGDLVTQPLDVTDPTEVAECMARIASSVGVPDFLFYTAGILNIDSLKATTPALWERAVDVNLNGAFYCVNAVAELMRSQSSGSIVVLGSIAGVKARSGSRVNPVYNATKAALAAFVNAAAMQLRPDRIRINCISPGPTQTTMMDLQPNEVHAAVNQITLDGRMNLATEVAELALFVAAHGRFTGEEVCLGGGAGLGG